VPWSRRHWIRVEKGIPAGRKVAAQFLFASDIDGKVILLLNVDSIKQLELIELYRTGLTGSNRV